MCNSSGRQARSPHVDGGVVMDRLACLGTFARVVDKGDSPP
jgi:hypothetical protein